MKELNDKELMTVNGGFSIGLGIAIGAGITFLIGVIDGLIKLNWQDLKNIVFLRNLSEKLLIQIR